MPISTAVFGTLGIVSACYHHIILHSSNLGLLDLPEEVQSPQQHLSVGKILTSPLTDQTAKSTFHPLFLMLWDLTPTAFEIREEENLLAVWLVGANGSNVRTFTKWYHHQITIYHSVGYVCMLQYHNIVPNRVGGRGELPLPNIRRGKLNSQFIVTARIDLSIFTKNFKFHSLLLLSLQ